MNADQIRDLKAVRVWANPFLAGEIRSINGQPITALPPARQYPREQRYYGPRESLRLAAQERQHILHPKPWWPVRLPPDPDVEQFVARYSAARLAACNQVIADTCRILTPTEAARAIGAGLFRSYLLDRAGS